MLLDEMEIFYYVAEFKSFSKAAQHLKVSKSFISKKITTLEQHLRANLILRSTRKLTLTEAGESFYSYATNIVREGNEAYSMIQELQGIPSGVLKISVPPALGLNLLAPLLPNFIRQNPKIKLEIELENRLANLIEEGYDLALRFAKLESSNLIAQRIFPIKNVICATEKYFQTNGMPKLPSDLEHHFCATYSYSKDANHIKLIENKREEKIYIKSYFASNHLDLVKKMILNDLYLAVLPEFMIQKELKTGKLKVCLTDYQLPENYLYAVYPQKKFMLPKLKCFLDMLLTPSSL